MIIYLCIKFESNTLNYSKDIKQKPSLLRTGLTVQDGRDGRMHGTDLRTDSRDNICPLQHHPHLFIENGGGIKKTYLELCYKQEIKELPYRKKDKYSRNIKILYLFLYENICCGFWLEASHWGTSNEYPQHMFTWGNKKNIRAQLVKDNDVVS